MSLQEIERGVGRWLLDMAPSVGPRPSEALQGRARLVFPDGRSIPITAELRLSRSFFSVAGEGHFHSEDCRAFEAINSGEPLELVFEGSTPVWIEVKEARTGVSGCRCCFVVHS
ncbi:hypothetical protein [Aestuariivirga sp.]|uniref:hypothetical protein n=1 Tax=Aestuariivirga sp. TaxID=2650926 RepID=UPI003919615D